MSDFTFFMTLFITSAVFGITMGAYFCTMEYRIRENLPLVTSDCICPSCGHRLALYQQIPIFGFFLLRGKCRYCSTPIPIRYPLTESVFLIYYTLTYCIFHRSMPVFMTLWYFMIILSLMRVKHNKHYHQLFRSLLIVTAYHAVIGLLYAIIYLAVYGSLFLKR